VEDHGRFAKRLEEAGVDAIECKCSLLLKALRREYPTYGHQVNGLSLAEAVERLSNIPVIAGGGAGISGDIRVAEKVLEGRES